MNKQQIAELVLKGSNTENVFNALSKIIAMLPGDFENNLSIVVGDKYICNDVIGDRQSMAKQVADELGGLMVDMNQMMTVDRMDKYEVRFYKPVRGYVEDDEKFKELKELTFDINEEVKLVQMGEEWREDMVKEFRERKVDKPHWMDYEIKPKGKYQVPLDFYEFAVDYIIPSFR